MCVCVCALQAAQSQAFTSELINNISQDGSSALHTIAANYQTGALAELLRYRSRCNLDLQDSKGYTPLHRIILGLLTQKAPRAALPMALDLLDAGCRIDIPSASQQTAIALAVDLADLAGVDAAHRGQDKVLRAMAAGRGTVVAGSTAFNVIGPRVRVCLWLSTWASHVGTEHCYMPHSMHPAKQGH